MSRLGDRLGAAFAVGFGGQGVQLAEGLESGLDALEQSIRELIEIVATDPAQLTPSMAMERLEGMAKVFGALCRAAALRSKGTDSDDWLEKAIKDVEREREKVQGEEAEKYL